MANDGEIRIGTKIDESGIDKGLKGLLQKLKSIGSSKTTAGIANVGMALGLIYNSRNLILVSNQKQFTFYLKSTTVEI